MRDGGRDGFGKAAQRTEIVRNGRAETLRRVKQTEYGREETKDRDAYKRHGHTDTDIVAVIPTFEKCNDFPHINDPTYTK